MNSSVEEDGSDKILSDSSNRRRNYRGMENWVCLAGGSTWAFLARGKVSSFLSVLENWEHCQE